MTHLSILTLTKNRAYYLQKNLQSLVGQTKPGDEIIIIDNASTDNTAEVLRRFTSRLPIRSYRTRIQGLSQLYNLAISKARNPLLLFFDDDCVASARFLTSHRNAHERRRPRVIQGMTYSIPMGNIYAEMMGDHYQNWLILHAGPHGTLDTFDNKNASLPRALLNRYGAFSTKYAQGAEDIELGIRLRSHVPIILDMQCVAYHHERVRLGDVIRQHLRFARTDALLARIKPQEKTLRMVDHHKVILHSRSAVRREIRYLLQGRLVDAALLPFVYIILFFVRIWGYATAR